MPARTVPAASARLRALVLALRSLLSFRWSTRFAEVTPSRTINGTATTIRPFVRSDRSSHHRRNPCAWSVTDSAEIERRDLTRYPLPRDYRDLTRQPLLCTLKVIVILPYASAVPMR